MPHKWKEQKIEALYRLIAELDSPEQCRNLFDDLCTKREVEKMAERLYAAKLLLQGYISTATLSRVSQCVQYGQGYSQLLKKQD